MPEKNEIKDFGIDIKGMIASINPTKKDPARKVVKVLAGDEIHAVLTKNNTFAVGDTFKFEKVRPFVTEDKSILYSHS